MLLQPLDKKHKALIQKARQTAIDFANQLFDYQQISSVASAVLMKDGKIYSAPNIYHPDSGPACICAEQVTLGKAYSESENRDVDTIVTYWHKEDEGEKVLSPCGRCRDFLRLFGDPWVIVQDNKGKRGRVRSKDLYPFVNEWVLSNQEESKTMEEIKLYTDGGSRGNPGPAAAAYVICEMDDTVVEKSGFYLGKATNNQAEYQALVKGLERVNEIGTKKLTVHLDSELVVKQVSGLYKVKNQDLLPLHQQVKGLADNFENIQFVYVPRALNERADAEVNRVLDKKTGA